MPETDCKDNRKYANTHRNDTCQSLHTGIAQVLTTTGHLASSRQLVTKWKPWFIQREANKNIPSNVYLYLFWLCWLLVVDGCRVSFYFIFLIWAGQIITTRYCLNEIFLVVVWKREKNIYIQKETTTPRDENTRDTKYCFENTHTHTHNPPRYQPYQLIKRKLKTYSKNENTISIRHGKTRIRKARIPK